MNRDKSLTPVPPRGFRWEPAAFWISLVIVMVLLTALVVLGDGPSIEQRAAAVVSTVGIIALVIWLRGGLRER